MNDVRQSEEMALTTKQAVKTFLRENGLLFARKSVCPITFPHVKENLWSFVYKRRRYVIDQAGNLVSA